MARLLEPNYPIMLSPLNKPTTSSPLASTSWQRLVADLTECHVVGAAIHRWSHHPCFLVGSFYCFFFIAYLFIFYSEDVPNVSTTLVPTVSTTTPLCTSFFGLFFFIACHAAAAFADNPNYESYDNCQTTPG